MQVVEVAGVLPVVSPFRRRNRLPYSHLAVPFRAQDDDPVVASDGHTRPSPAPLGPCVTRIGAKKAPSRRPASVGGDIHVSIASFAPERI